MVLAFAEVVAPAASEAIELVPTAVAAPAVTSSELERGAGGPVGDAAEDDQHMSSLYACGPPQLMHTCAKGQLGLEHLWRLNRKQGATRVLSEEDFG